MTRDRKGIVVYVLIVVVEGLSRPLVQTLTRIIKQGKEIRTMTYYKTFKRSCTNWNEFSTARKITEETGLTLEQAREA